MDKAIATLQGYYDIELADWRENHDGEPDTEWHISIVDNAFDLWSRDIAEMRSALDDSAADQEREQQDLVCTLIDGLDYSRLADAGFKF